MSILDKLKKKPGRGTRAAKKDDVGRVKFASVSSGKTEGAGVKGEKPAKTGVYGLGDIDRVLAGAWVTEKATLLRRYRQYVFEVGSGVNKTMVRRAFAVYYGVNPKSIRMVSLTGKRVRWGKTQGVTKRRKKVIVTLPEGTSIEVSR